jgi:intracellular septation protein
MADEWGLRRSRATNGGHVTGMSTKKRFFPFTAEQTVNILSEFGPLMTMFIVNAIYGINTGTWALIISTGVAIAVMFYMFGRPPVFPLIASTVTIIFGALTLVTGDPMWVQIKVTIFNAMFAAFLFIGLWLNKNFFKYVFEKTFHYTKEGWDSFTRSFAWFFVLTAVLNEIVRLTFEDEAIYNVFGYEMNGVNIWIAFKILIIMPLSGIYGWILTRLMAKHRLPDPGEAGDESQPQAAVLGTAVAGTPAEPPRMGPHA